MKFIVLLVSLLFFINGIFGNTCTIDSECGWRRSCPNSLEIHAGVGIDHSENKIYVMGVSKSFANTVIASIPINGGPIQIEYEITTDFMDLSALGIFKYLPKSKLLYTINSQRLGLMIGLYEKNGTLTSIWNARGFKFQADFNEHKQETLTCGFGIYKYESIPKTSGEANKQLYKNVNCLGLGRLDNFVYGVKAIETGSLFFKGSLECKDREESELSHLFKEPLQVSDMAVTSTHIYYSTMAGNGTDGIYEMPLSCDHTKKRLLVKDTTKRISLHNGIIYYATEGKLKSVSISSCESKTLYCNNGKYQGECACAKNYFGSECTKCNGQEVWDPKGSPNCLITDKYSITQCIYQWNCNTPFGYCDGANCRCRSSFYGSKCDKCDGKVTYKDGVPSCEN
ncbi:hypothetical protein CYY_006785 [Polysphondylium violaceum]|uniref:EGF-like domain-containing protein n=1 Tax=Polysphondylium violaceum TaxID=133409 RepID=A0A8J4PZ08_9MYCE|nr:hypothetical protein CYY_006785 [Polysphondylium violaceum]